MAVEGLIWELFRNDNKSSLVSETINILEQANSSDAGFLQRQLSRLGKLCELIRSMPSLYHREEDDDNRSLHSLLEHLSNSTNIDGELGFPLKATLSQALLVSKIQFFRACVRAINIEVQKDPSHTKLAILLHKQLADIIYTQMAEQILLTLINGSAISLQKKYSAAQNLIAIWEDDSLEAHDFCPLLDAAWLARNQIDVEFGSLIGTIEYFDLVSQHCPPKFLDFFSRTDVSAEEKEAFDEFLFDMTFEELSKIRKAMKEENLSTVDHTWVEKTLGRKLENEHIEELIQPMTLYRSYQRRRYAAQIRQSAHWAGPQYTAETYIMLYLLDSQIELPSGSSSNLSS